MINKLEALQNSEGFVQALDNISTPEQMQELLAKHGVEMTLDEVRDMVANAVKLTNDELSADDLENVAGGTWYIEVGKFVLDQVGKWFVKKFLDKVTGW